ncbi:Acetyl esterase/lipase [Chryseobacterium taeanense]|uniref:Acetyl esterase/lipase n=1 Tax=Chryseobacterium taeanense TaxID=311334 RepID=A0A1G8GWP8_9FLAO|nr:alpha/beta hydrolase [Chryseobacterium taeanense]SDH98804.1 Acetyl esterase/lipase [Chryseobacterium taeanense]
MRTYLSVLGVLLLILSSCQQKTIDFGNNISFRIEKNIPYGKETEQKMDVYIPESTVKDNDVFMIIHGGGWRGGKKSQLTSFTFDLMKKFPKKIFVNVDYRLASATSFALPDQTDDIKTAMNYLEKKLKINPKYILLGNSAGGHLSMMYAYKFDKDKKVKAVINIVGPANLNDPGFKNYVDYTFVEKQLIDPKTVGTKTTLMNFGSPVHWISTTSAPTLSYYGMNDQVVPLSQMKILDSVLNKNNVYHESYEFNGDHLGWEKDSNAKFLIQKTDEFLKNIDKK